MASIHKQTGRPNWFCAFYDPEGFRRFRSTGTENSKIARTICVNVERAAALTRQGKLSNEKALKLVRETCDSIAETHGKLAANRAEAVLKTEPHQTTHDGKSLVVSARAGYCAGYRGDVSPRPVY
jgi:hypothetical protein